MNRLKEGFISYKDLMAWFGFSTIPKPKNLAKRLIELKPYAQYNILDNGINITKVNIPIYIKRNKSRDNLYAKYINKAIKSKPYLTEQEVVNYVLANAGEDFTDSNEIAQFYIKEILKEQYPQEGVFTFGNDAQRDLFKKVQNENAPENPEGMSPKAYNFLMGRAQSFARVAVMDKYGQTPVEVGRLWGKRQH